MLDLGLDLGEAPADEVEQVAALLQLAFQGGHRQGIAQGLALQAVGIALQGAGEGAQALAQGRDMAAVDLQGAARIPHQQAAEQAGQGFFGDLAGACQLVDQHGGLEDAAQGDELFLGAIHAAGASAQAGW